MGIRRRRGQVTPRRIRLRAASALLLALALAAGAPASGETADPEAGDQLDESADAQVDDRLESMGGVADDPSRPTPPEPPNVDPWEKMNRGIFWVNEKADIYAIAPVARGWRFITPSFARKGVENFNGLLLMPVVFANDVLQLKPRNAAQDVARTVWNATFGIAGFIDFATMIDIPENDEDFGQTLGFWGIPQGPYLVLPVFGPSTVRDGVGRLGDTAATFYFSLIPFWSTFLVRSVDLINLRSRYLEEIDENRRESFDYYVFLRDAYLQNRQARVDRARGVETDPVPEDEDLYYFDDEPYDDEVDDPDAP